MGLFSILFFLAFFAVLGVIIVTAIRGVSQWNKNNNSPILTVDAKAVAKRIAVNHHHGGGGAAMNHSSTSTTYYVTFEVESGDRIELRVSGSEYGLIVEGDAGRLTFQGTRYKGFERRMV